MQLVTWRRCRSRRSTRSSPPARWRVRSRTRSRTGWSEERWSRSRSVDGGCAVSSFAWGSRRRPASRSLPQDLSSTRSQGRSSSLPCGSPSTTARHRPERSRSSHRTLEPDEVNGGRRHRGMPSRERPSPKSSQRPSSRRSSRSRQRSPAAEITYSCTARREAARRRSTSRPVQRRSRAGSERSCSSPRSP